MSVRLVVTTRFPPRDDAAGVLRREWRRTWWVSAAGVVAVVVPLLVVLGVAEYRVPTVVESMNHLVIGSGAAAHVLSIGSTVAMAMLFGFAASDSGESRRTIVATMLVGMVYMPLASIWALFRGFRSLPLGSAVAISVMSLVGFPPILLGSGSDLIDERLGMVMAAARLVMVVLLMASTLRWSTRRVGQPDVG
jgi:hypothetical protein